RLSGRRDGHRARRAHLCSGGPAPRSSRARARLRRPAARLCPGACAARLCPGACAARLCPGARPGGAPSRLSPVAPAGGLCGAAPPPLKRVLILHTGGTLGMTPSHQPAPLRPDSYARAIVSRVPELADLAHIETRILCNLDSSDIGP